MGSTGPGMGGHRLGHGWAWGGVDLPRRRTYRRIDPLFEPNRIPIYNSPNDLVTTHQCAHTRALLDFVMRTRATDHPRRPFVKTIGTCSVAILLATVLVIPLV